MTTQSNLLKINASSSGFRTPVVLLRLLTLSLYSCIAIIASSIMYWSITDTLSNYRRQMNEAAFNAQYFVTQQDSLLKSISTSTVRNTESTLISIFQMPRSLSGSQLRGFPLEHDGIHYQWTLILTERDLVDIDSTQNKLVYLSPDQSQIHKLFISDIFGAELKLDSSFNGRWDQDAAQGLLNQNTGRKALWLSASEGNSKKIYLLRPVNDFNSEDGWLGLELSQIEHAFTPSKRYQGKYVLYDAAGAAVLNSSSWDIPEALAHFQAAEDTFGIKWKHGLPEYIVLNKSVGGSGWRLVYYLPTTQLLHDTLLPLYVTAQSTLLLCFGIFLGARYVRRHLVEPAARYHHALSESVSLNSRIIEVAPVGLCLVRCDNGSLILSNESGRKWLASIPERLKGIISSYQNGIHTFEHELSDGRSIQLTCAAIGYSGTAAVLCCMSDVTEFKRTEQSMLLAKNLSDQASREKTLFLSTLSHEIRTPMYGILGSLEMLRTTQLSVQQSDYLEASQQASSALMRTINDSLDMSLIESGRLVLNKESFSPVHLVEEVALNYSARARSKGLQLYVTLDPRTPDRVIGDGGRIRQILNNLLSNAIKFTESGHVILRLHCEHEVGDNWQLRFQVVDTGPGIADEFQPNLFEPYYRVPGRVSQNTAGTGLGLAICSRLAQMMFGSLEVFSEPGLGSSFDLSLLLAHCSTPLKPTLLVSDITPVYVYGDVPEVVQNLCQWLHRWGFLAVAYTHGMDVKTNKSVLVEAFLGASKPVVWSGPRVIMRAPGIQPLQRQAGNSWIVRTFSLDSMLGAVTQAQTGIVTKMRLSPSRDRMLKMNLKLLTVDDSPMALQVILQQTTYLGNQVVAVKNAVDALEHADLMSFDAVLTDLQMQHLDGLAFARTLRERGFLGPIIGISGETSPELRTCCESAGIRHLLVKPVPLDALFEVLQSVKRKVK
ncbi:MAG: response regulator [Gammaproteobacteria bacterium]|nr:response regulator [Gammaproteobacteria bacterium]MBU0817460.1 response regulator [Gammaproteobacteria bacterium]MBU0845128.1 response regulator [Gammaproteobacteria bacterium]MBU1839865.1 response regulator [Gammaproteobacteria bacterium]